MAYPSAAHAPWTCRTLAAGESLESVYGAQWTDLARFNRIDRRHARPGVGLRHPDRLEDVLGFCPLPAVRPDNSDEARLLVVDRAEQFLAAYEWGQRVLCLPVATGRLGFETPAGAFRLTAADRNHRSSRYPIAGTRIPYPMRFGLRFLTTRSGSSFWLHGRDLPGAPASHGCIGLADEEMQRRYYGLPLEPILDDARQLFAWAIGSEADTGRQFTLPSGPRMLVVGDTPRPRSAIAAAHRPR
jgi:L,D-transpeptidase catalytic domain